jgi:hypothetical protein
MTKEKHHELAEKILYYCLENGLSFKLSGGNCITWHPPLTVRQRAYILYFTQPKQSKTRESRVEKCMQQILNGKGLND